MEIEPVGTVRRASERTCLLEVFPQFQDALDGLEAGDEVQVLYWMHKLPDEQRRMLKAHPRGDRDRPLRGVFALRSPMRPNPIGVSVVRVQKVEGCSLTVLGLDAVGGSPVIDIKAAPGPHSSPSALAEN